jgi:hypothetical protein
LTLLPVMAAPARKYEADEASPSTSTRPGEGSAAARIEAAMAAHAHQRVISARVMST